MNKPIHLLVALSIIALTASAICQDVFANHRGNKTTAETRASQNARDKAIDSYLANLKMNIAQNWCPPSGKSSTWGVVYFELDKTGSLKKLDMLKSSNIIQIDRSILTGIENAAPFGSLPDSQNQLGFRLAFHYFPDTQSQLVTSRQFEDQIEYMDKLKNQSRSDNHSGNKISSFSTRLTYIDTKK